MAPTVVTGVPTFTPPPITKADDQKNQKIQEKYQADLLRKIVQEYRKHPDLRKEHMKKKVEEKGLRGLYMSMKQGRILEKDSPALEKRKNLSNKKQSDEGSSGEDTDTLLNTIQRDLFLVPTKKNQTKIDYGKMRQLEVNTVLEVEFSIKNVVLVYFMRFKDV